MSYSQSYPQYPQKYTMFVVFVSNVSSSKVCFVISDKFEQKWQKRKCLTWQAVLQKQFKKWKINWKNQKILAKCSYKCYTIVEHKI